MRVTIYRHGQSTANADAPTDNPRDIPLTPLGIQQAEILSKNVNLDDVPTLIVTSPYIRTGETSAPLRKRFPRASHEEWPIQEFTYLCAEKYRGTTRGDRVAHVTAFWDKADPNHKEPGTESLIDLFGRVDAMVDRLEEYAETDPLADVVIFGHGQFMRAILWRMLTNSDLIDADGMRAFRAFCSVLVVPNTAALPLRYNLDNEWFVGALSVAHLPPEFITV